MKHSKFTALLILLPLILIVGCGPCAPEASPPPATDVPTEKPASTEKPEPTVAPTEEKPAGTWEVILQVEADPTSSYAGFTDDSFGIATGHFGHVGRAFYTTDGGQSWTQISSAPKAFGMDVVNGKLAWAVGEGSQVWVTKDSAQTWEAASNASYPGTLPFVTFVDDTTGWVASPEHLDATSDGGQTWTTLTLPKGVDVIAAISLRTASDGYLLDNAGTLYTTQDGGQSWSSQALELEGDILTVPTIPFTALRFTDADHGLIVLSIMGMKGELIAMRTADGGQTWKQKSLPIKANPLYLTHDGMLLTITNPSQEIAVLRYQE